MREVADSVRAANEEKPQTKKMSTTIGFVTCDLFVPFKVRIRHKFLIPKLVAF